ncbi:hypothetical protein IBHPHPPA_00016 [Salmonella phage KKP 3828]|uniref:Ead/Ea22-like family protein n=1 Tax=Salmonella phage KKP 3828 TaxID=3041358 RepID=A0AA50IHK6_9CAUD|nr:hypothetical protein IBHPHPPA_00016 [Salmonella phage KKP 3828]
MSLPRYDLTEDLATGEVDITPVPETQAGRYVAYEDYAALEARCAALAAENAGLRDINAWCKTDAFKNMYREFKTAESLGCPDVDCMHDAMLTAIMHAPETPATDAFLAEVRAQGVEMLTADRKSEWVVSYIDDANDFAAQLRKGVI